MTICASWVRLEQGRQASPSEPIIDSQSIKSAAMVSQDVGFDGGKLIHGRKRFLSVDTLGLVLRVFVTAASVGERSGGFLGTQTSQKDGFIRVPSAHDLGRWWV